MRQCPKCGKRFLAETATVCDADGSELQLVVVTSARDRLVGAVVADRYQIDAVIGDGGMGVVYRAHDVHDPRVRYAIKVLRVEYSTDEDLVTRFEQEAIAVSRIQHENIVRVYEFGALPDGSRYFVMEYLEGKSLGRLLAEQGKGPSGRRRPLPEARTIRIARQICNGLQAAHALNIVHRDMKPDNVHLIRHGTETDVVKILDFGIAKVQGSTSARTRTGSVFGTPHYMSPEQASGERDIDARTDIYALGVLMYEMATGKVPFDADNVMGILTAHLYTPPVPPRQQPGGETISPGLEAVILKALAKRREARYQSMEALRLDLDRVAQGLEPLAMSDLEDATRPLSRQELQEIMVSPPAFSPGMGDDKPTMPAGRMARVPSVPPPGWPSDTSLPEGVIVASTNAESALTATPEVAMPMVTGRSIPPVTSHAGKNGSKNLWLAVALGVVGMVTFAAAGVILLRRNRPAVSAAPSVSSAASQQARTVPSSNASSHGVASQAPLPAATSEVRSPTITLQSDPPGAQVYLGRRRIGETPLEVARPPEGTSETYTLSAPGRMRVAAVVRADAPRAILFALPPRTSSPRSSGERTGRSELLDPWAEEQR